MRRTTNELAEESPRNRDKHHPTLYTDILDIDLLFHAGGIEFIVLRCFIRLFMSCILNYYYSAYEVLKGTTYKFVES